MLQNCFRKQHVLLKVILFMTVLIQIVSIIKHKAYCEGRPLLEVESIADAANGYGGVKLDIQLPADYSDNYVYVVERSENCLNWEKTGLTFEYSDYEKKVCAKTVRVLNVYPDNQSYALPQNIESRLTEEEKLQYRNVYQIPDGDYTFADGSKSILPKSAALKIWMEGGSYQEGGSVETFQSVAKYHNQQMITVDVMGMSQFNASMRQLSDLTKYDVLFFGTWDANAWNDLTEQSCALIEQYIKTYRGVIFGHDTIAGQILDKGVYSGEEELKNFYRLKRYMNFDMVPYSYKEASLESANAQGYLLPLRYQIWGGSEEKGGVWVRFLRAENKINSSLTTFPNNLLQGQGKIRSLKVPNTHTAWMGLKSQDQNAVCFAANEYTLLSDFVGNAYTNSPNMQYNWYLASGDPAYSCCMIQTGHSRCRSEIDERQLIANVIANINKTETSRNVRQSKVDVSAQDYAKPIVNQPTLIKNSKNTFRIKLQGIDQGTSYSFRVRVLAAERGTVSCSDIKNINVTTGISNYYYILDQKNENYDFNLSKAQSVSLNQNDRGILCENGYLEDSYLHIKAVDYAGNVSEPVCIDLSQQFQAEIQPLDIHSDNDGVLYQTDNLVGVRHYYVRENAEFELSLQTGICPFAYGSGQPYCNQINFFKAKTSLDVNQTGGTMDTATQGFIHNSIAVQKSRQFRMNELTQLRLSLMLSFKKNTDGTTVLLEPSGYILVNGVEKKSKRNSNANYLYITCDGEGPEIECKKRPYWFHAGNYAEAAILQAGYHDKRSGFRMSIVSLTKKENGSDKALAYKMRTNESVRYVFNDAKDEGIYYFRIIARDYVSNESTKLIPFGIDKTPPIIHELQSCYGWTNQDVNFRITATDNLSGIGEIRLLSSDGKVICKSDCSVLEYRFSTEQDSVYYVEAQDVAGNVCERRRFQVKIDKTMPEIVGSGLTSEYLDRDEPKTVYYIPSDQIQVSASDPFYHNCRSGMKLLLLKDQNETVIAEKKHINAGGFIAGESDFTIEHEVLSAQESDFYSIVAEDWAGNIRRVYIVPQICTVNRIRRTILHDNYEDTHGYYRIYE